MRTIMTIGGVGTPATRGAFGARVRAVREMAYVLVERFEKKPALVHRLVSPIVTDSTTGVSVPRRRYRT
ncbi:hypothetical protein [Pseudonocardia asaccharolytica]|uniref:Uncharacterized protein n=1 Tax=Pseudonocardia asaccharolytica DSM 44247 = NBRC 16224 TaxID=1123024 RepID=A0A511D1U1_9PSEU|nr:hypothetical protein [Pseudonocardia asaccharolytica]GEL18657.1 hypothetical protein PA7_24940 [Pseudonocardia asaccharolytica DSM 44247 = NBRC 16224]